MAELPHIEVRDTARTEQYTRPSRPVNNSTNLPPRDRTQHADKLIHQLQRIQEQEEDIIRQQKAFGVDAGNGIYLSFESSPSFDLKIQSLENQAQGIELCTSKMVDDRTIATVFVPEGKLAFFLKRVSAYRDEDTTPRSADKPTKPKHQDLVEGIEEIKLAALEQLWTDDPALFPRNDGSLWWEVWLRRSDTLDYEAFVRERGLHLGLVVGQEAIHFLDRIVLLVYGNREQMTRSVTLLGAIVEVRCAKDVASFFTGLDRRQQQEWIEDARNRLVLPQNTDVSVCLLDTGLNQEHPLLSPMADPGDLHTYLNDWGVDDRVGHGTPMAGLAAYGDLVKPLTEEGPIQATHCLESVKIIQSDIQVTDAADKRLYGAVTRESVGRVEVNANRKRVYCMAVTTSDDRDRGKPSSWSALVDALAAGAEDEEKRLFVLSAGNTVPAARHHYPESNFTDEVHDPGQSWNALTVGGYTEKTLLDTNQYPGWSPLASAGDLSPSSCTSMEWAKGWPIKPDIVMEAGNMALHPEHEAADYIDDALSLLTTGHQFAFGKQLVAFGDTSAAAALAARLCAKTFASYPTLWPETVRALIVHSARWTDAMKSRFAPLRTKNDFGRLLRYVGYGVPNETELLWSARNALTLIAQERLQPYFKDEKNEIKTRDIHIHTLPWPSNELRELPADTLVEMKVTLSYFIEPNPGERGWANRYRYASHGLRFDVRRPLETVDNFRQRINKQARDAEHGYSGVKDSGKWMLGDNLRSIGSIHSDTWVGTAAELAERGYLAVYPVIGWWKERKNFERWVNEARYALVVSIKTPSVETDIYTPVANQVGIAVET